MAKQLCEHLLSVTLAIVRQPAAVNKSPVNGHENRKVYRYNHQELDFILSLSTYLVCVLRLMCALLVKRLFMNFSINCCFNDYFVGKAPLLTKTKESALR